MAATSSGTSSGWAVSAGGVFQAKGRALWMFRSPDSETPLRIETATGLLTLSPAPATHLVGIARNARIQILNNTVLMHDVGVARLVKLIAFIDCSVNDREPLVPASIRRAVTTFCVSGFAEPDTLSIQREFICRLLERDSRDVPLFSFLRATEAYWVVSFLLQQFAENKRVSDLGAQYGLSNAHFRRLCKHALGGSLKAELKRWRASSAVLRIIESEQTLTDIALDAGFASSSHLSREIKGLLGVPPSQIWGFGVGRRWTRTRESATVRQRDDAYGHDALTAGYTHHLSCGGAR